VNKLVEGIIQPSEMFQAAAGHQQPFMPYWAHREHQPHYHGFCPYCCHPMEACCCCKPHCRREPKELLVQPAAQKKEAAISDAMSDAIKQHVTQTLRMMRMSSAAGQTSAAKTTAKPMEGKAPPTLEEPVVTPVVTRMAMSEMFIGGGCCVHLSIEYMPDNPLAAVSGAVLAMVIDSEATILAWCKVVGAKSGYQIKENIITTYPGALLVAAAENVIARVRWCEVFSG
jgi:aconitase B